MSAKTKFVVWDWNGTLIDDLEINVVCANINLERAGKKLIDAAGYQAAFDVPIAKFYRNVGFSDHEIERDSILMQDLFHDHYDRLILDIGFRVGVREVLGAKRVDDVSHVILSNHLIESIEQHLDRLKSRELFDCVMAHEDRLAQASWAPKIERLHVYMAQQGFLPDNGIIVGDTPEEIHIGRTIGLVSVAVTGGFASEERLLKEQPDYLIHSLDELKPVLHARGFVA